MNLDFQLVLFPGLDGTGKLFEEFIKQFPGESGVTIIPYLMERHISFNELHDYTIPLLPKDKPLVLLGESYSGPVVLSLAARGDLNIAGIILVATFAKYPGSFLKTFSRLVPLSLLFRLPIPDFVIRTFCFGECKNKTLYKKLRESVKANKPSVLAKRAHEGASVDVTELLSSIKVPCLYIAASNDNMMPISAITTLQKKLPQMEVVTVDGSHFILQVKPEECFEIVDEFFGDLPVL